MDKQQKKPPKKLSNLKKAVKLEAALIKARHEAEYKFFKSKKGIVTAIREQLTKSKLSDVIDITAIGFGTYIVHELIINSPELSDKALRFTASSVLFGVGGMIYQYAHQLNILPWDKYTAPAKLKDNLAYWIIGFFAAFLMVRHGGQILGLMKEGAGSLSTVVTALMA